MYERGFKVECSIDWTERKIYYYDQFTDRILDNMVSNLEKYADKTYPVEICSFNNGCYYGISVKNIRSHCYDKTKSNGVGIENIRNMMKDMKGKCTVRQTKNEFIISLLFCNTI